MRWIGEGENLQKWYIKSIMPKISKQLGEGDPQTHGFKEGKRGGKMVVVERGRGGSFRANADGKAGGGLKRRGVDGYNIGAVHREMVGARVELVIPGAGKTKPYNMTKGGVAGRVDTPEWFRIMSEDALLRVREVWERKKWGISMGGDGELVTHVCWADNLWLVAETEAMGKQMFLGITAEIRKLGWDWKASSLKIMKVGMGAGEEVGGERKWKVKRKEYVIPEVKNMTVLGSWVERDGKSEKTVEKQIRDGGKTYFGQKASWGKHGGWKEKAKKWQRDVQSVVLWGAGTWELSTGIINRMRKWELAMLRGVFGMGRRKKENGDLEDVWIFKHRSAKKIYRVMREAGVKMLYQVAVERILDEAWRGKEVGLAERIRAERSRRWWEGIKEEPVAKRRKGVTKHGRKGPVRMWEDVVIACKGGDWREELQSCGGQQEWRRGYEDALRKMFTEWKIPMGTLEKKKINKRNNNIEKKRKRGGVGKREGGGDQNR